MEKNDGKNEPPNASEAVKVIVRCRPMSPKEIATGYRTTVKVFPEGGVVEVQGRKKLSSPKYFRFDAVFDGGAQKDLYDEVFRPLVDSVLDGFNGTILAYGQTGAGKTYTMEGIVGDVENEGVIPNSFLHIFNNIARTEDVQYLVSASYLEIYQEEVHDLLSAEPTKRLEVREKNDTGIYVKDLTICVCKTVEDLLKVMADGKRNRSIGKTNMNAHSSRSHAIFIISIESCKTDSDGNQHYKIGKLNLVDLAGSERQDKTGAKGVTQKESIKINLSLSALGNVISALVDGKSTHVPYRDSKLTRLLQDSLGGNAKTIMIANIGPANYNYEETLTTLRYANRAKNIKNKPVINVDPKDALLTQYKEEIARLKAQLALKEAKRKRKKEAVKVIEEEEEESANEVMLRKMENLLSEEKVAFINQQNLMAEEKERILKVIKEKDEELQRENEAKEKLSIQLQELEAQLLCGGKNIIDHTNEQQRVLEKRRQELVEQKRRERDIEAKLLEEEETTLEKKETYDSLQSEVEIKSRKLKKLLMRMQSLKEDIADEQEINSIERQEKEQTIETLARELKLSNLVIDNYVDPERKEKFLEQVRYDEDDDAWIFTPDEAAACSNPSSRPISALQCRRAMTSYAKKRCKASANPRYMSENVDPPQLVLPSRRTTNYEPNVDPFVIESIRKNVLGDEWIDCRHVTRSVTSADVESKIPPPTRSSSTRTPTYCGRHLKPKVDIEQYPVPRGLVPK